MSARGSRYRVAHVITRMNIGGPALHVLLLAARLDPLRYETVILTGSTAVDEGELMALPGEAPPRIVRIPSLARAIAPVRDLRATGELFAALRRERPDIVHTHMAKAGALGRVTAHIAGVRAVVHTFHGNVMSGYFGGTATRGVVMAERALARISDAIIALSARQALELQRRGIASPPRLVHIPLGLDLTPFAKAGGGSLRAELGVAASVPIVGIVARLVPIKGVDLFLAAAERVARRWPDARFVIVGDGEERSRLEAQARSAPLLGSVTFLGWRQDLPALHADIDVLVQSSRNEGTPTSIIEAMAASRAIVATAVGGVPDLLGPATGVLVPAGDADAIADAVVSLLEDPLRRATIGRAARDAALGRYDARLLIERMSELYASLVAPRR